MAEGLFPGRDNYGGATPTSWSRVQDRSIHFQRIFGSCRRESTRLFLTTVLRSAVSTKCCQIIANTKKRMK